MPDISLELLCLIPWLFYSWLIRILSYRIISWWFILFYLVVIMDNLGCAYSVDWDMRCMVYRWGFSCLDYPLEVSISWIYLLSPYNWFCHIYLSYYLMPHSYSCVIVLTTRFSMHTLLFRFTDTRVLILTHHLAFTTPLVGEFWLPWILMSRFRSLELVDSPCCWSEWRSENVNHRQTIWSPILPGPLLGFRVFLLWLWASFCTVNYCKSFVFSHLRHIGDVILL